MSSPMIETLVENSKYINQGQEADGPSACETQCKSQQDALISCMDSIRDAKENGSSTDEKANACLAPSVASWTACCSKANGHAS